MGAETWGSQSLLQPAVIGHSVRAGTIGMGLGW